MGTACCDSTPAITGLASQSCVLDDGFIMNKSNNKIYYLVSSQMEKRSNAEYHTDTQSKGKVGISLQKLNASASGEVSDKKKISGNILFEQVEGLVTVQPKCGSAVGLLKLQYGKHKITIYNEEGVEILKQILIKHVKEIRYLIKSKGTCIIVNSLDEEHYIKVLNKWNKDNDDEDNEDDERQENQKRIKLNAKLSIPSKEIQDDAHRNNWEANQNNQQQDGNQQDGNQQEGNQQWTCQQNHPLVQVCGKQSGYSGGFYCNVCRKQVDMSKPWRRCKICNFDLCKQCIVSRWTTFK